MMKKVKSHMKALFYNPSDRVLVIGLLATFKLPCCTSRIHERAAVWVLPFFVESALRSTVNRHKSPATSIAAVVASVQLAGLLRQKKLLRSYSEVVNYLLKPFANDLAILKKDSTVWRYTPLPSMTPVQYTNDLNAKSSKVANVYHDSKLNGIFI